MNGYETFSDRENSLLLVGEWGQKNGTIENRNKPLIGYVKAVESSVRKAIEPLVHSSVPILLPFPYACMGTHRTGDFGETFFAGLVDVH